MGRGKRTQVALSDSQRRRRLPLIDTSLPGEHERLVEALVDQLGLTFDRFTSPPRPEDRYLFFLSAPDYKGEPFCALDRAFPDTVAAQQFYVSRRDDPDDPNPLPQLVLDLEDERPHFTLLRWHKKGFDMTGADYIEFGPQTDPRMLYAELEELDQDY